MLVDDEVVAHSMVAEFVQEEHRLLDVRIAAPISLGAERVNEAVNDRLALECLDLVHVHLRLGVA